MVLQPERLSRPPTPQSYPVRTAPPTTVTAPSTSTAPVPVLTPITRSGGRSGILPPLPTPAPQPAPAYAGALAPAGSRVGLAQMMTVGAFLGLLWRLVLVFPADLVARLLANTAGTAVPGSLEAWLPAPAADEGFLRLFVLATWWAGALVGVVLVWRNGGRLTDLVCGLIAGAVAGLAGSATLACVLVAADALPRWLLHAVLGDRAMGPALATPLWILTSLVCWLVEGAALGFVLGLLGRAGAADAGGGGARCWCGCCARAGWGMRRSFLRCGGNEEGDLLHNSRRSPGHRSANESRTYLPCSSSNRTRSPSPAASAERNISRCPRNCSSASSSAGRLLRKMARHSFRPPGRQAAAVVAEAGAGESPPFQRQDAGED